MRTFFRALQARKIDRVVAAYAAAGWFLVQGAAIALPTFNAPSWVLKVFILVVMIGFPLTIWIAWIAMPHPHHRAPSLAVPMSHTDRALIALLGFVIVVSAGQFIYEFWVPNGVTSASNLSAPSKFLTEARPARSQAAESIAVLPFINLSGDPSKEYFSDGIAEEILNQLSNTPQLHVAARTSSFAFKGKSEDIKEIARALNVNTVLEGTVREEGNHIRLTTRLINATDGYEVWAQTYDRELTEILRVQDEIAQAITSALTHRLIDAAGAAAGKPMSINPKSFRTYLKGQYYFALRTEDGIVRATDLFKQVTLLQPDFAGGFASLSRAYIAGHVPLKEKTERDTLAALAAAEALRLDPDNLDALFTHLRLAQSRWDWRTSSSDFQRMQAINPHNPTTLLAAYFFFGNLGFPDQATSALRQAIELDPLSIVLQLNLSGEMTELGNAVDGVSTAEAVLQLRPGHPPALYYLCLAETQLGNLSGANRALAQISKAQSGWQEQDCAFNIAVKSNRTAEARQMADEFAAGFPDTMRYARNIAYDYLKLHDYNKATDWLQRAYELREDVPWAASYAREMAALRATPRGRALLASPLIQEWQSAHNSLAVELRKKSPDSNRIGSNQ